MFSKFFLLFCFIANWSFSDEQKKATVWFLAGHMQNIFEEAYFTPMLTSGYDLRPMFQLKAQAAKQGYMLTLADPNALELIPFSDIRSGIREVGLKKNKECSAPLTPAKNIDCLVVFEVMEHQLKYLIQYPKERLILFLWEPPSVMPSNYRQKNHEHFFRVYTWNDHLVDNVRYYKFHYPVLQLMIEDRIPFHERKLCTMVAGNKTSQHSHELYGERRKLIQFFEDEHVEDFDLYGKWWPESFKTYKGSIEDKTSILKHYKFCVAYENIQGLPGYITEKIFDAFKAGCVPIYLGASNITSYIPKKCFIDRRDFESNAQLYKYIKAMTESEYSTYIESIQDFLKSEKARVFSPDHFVKTVIGAIQDVCSTFVE